MSGVSFDVRPLAGPDLLQRRGDIVLLVAAGAGGPAVDSLLELVDTAAGEGADGRKLVRRLARLLTAEDDTDQPAFVALAPAGDGMAVLVHGDAIAEIEAADGERESLSGRTAAAWIDRIVPWPAASIVAVTSASASDAPVPRSELRDGVVPAGGFVITPADARPAPQSATPEEAAPESTASMPVPSEAAAEAAPEFESISLMAADEADTEPREPLPVAGAGSDNAAAPPDGDVVLVKGIKCKRDHFNSPNAAFCGVCGISMVQQTHQLVDGPRPPLGVIVLDDGTTFGLDADYVIGREPENDEDVSAGRIRGLTIEDPDGSVSRVHALIKLDEWDVVMIDRDSANGTRISPPGLDAWTSLVPHEPVLIVPGTKVEIGARTFIYDAHHRV